MAMATATSAQAIRMGLRQRMPMVIRRAIRCGVRAGRFFNGRWRNKFLSSRAQKDAAFRLSRDAAFFICSKMQWTVVSTRYSVLKRSRFGDARGYRQGEESFSAVVSPAADERTTTRG